ncbi:MAG: NAD(P)/FAD-dependent oxidoreductase [Thermodesulfobacteriota bacterium]|nr:NAD(P)/FAD-dependent oxidoreductase [Thermodesulfobacteriota bacterium]
METYLLSQPYHLKNLLLRNRIVMAPMLSRLCYPEGIVSPQLIDYYAERARGGVGLIIVEYCYIDEKESKANQGQLGVYDDQLIAGLGDLAEAIQEWGTKAVLQICHGGRSTSAKFMGRQPIAPSAMPSYTGEMAREMTLSEIENTIESFAEAARRAKTAGFDGVELHGTHGYLMAQFLSPYTNRRPDVYGRDRGLFALQTLERVRSKVGKDYLVGYRMSGEEFIEGGITLQETKAFAKRLEERGIDYIHVSAGIIETGQHFVIPMYFPKGHLLYLSEGIKSAVNIPVIAVGALHDPLLAEQALKKKQADLIAMGRALIADPELPNKIQSGRTEDIRTCLRCNEGCSSRVRQSKTQRCAVNAEVGRERQMRIHPVLNPKHVCIIGGGPAGMEAARVLALRRHRVTLIEKEKELGGLLRYAAVPDFKAELRSFLEYQKTQVKKLGVEVLLNRRATLDFLKELKPDKVVLAAGSSMSIPEIPGSHKPFVATAIDLLSGKYQTGDRVLVAGGAAMGCEVAAHLASLGKKVTLVEMLGDLALDLEMRSRLAILQLLKERGVEVLTGWKLVKIEEGYALLLGGDWKKMQVKADSFILALGLTSNQELLKPLTETFGNFFVIGDCLEPRKIYQAIHEGAFTGRAI